LRPPFDVNLPKRAPWPWIAIGASVLLHSLLLFGWVDGRIPDVPRLPRQLIVLSAPAAGPEPEITPYQRFEPTGERGRSRLPEPRRGVGKPVRPALPARAEEVTVLPAPKPEPVPVDTTTDAGRDQTAAGRIGPGLAEGRLWVRPLPLPPQELAQRLSRTKAQLVDSAVTRIVQAYLDSIAGDPSSRDLKPPSWTTELVGKKFGIDEKNIYIAGLKIPVAVLALLPIPAGNIDQNRAYNHLMDLRADLQYAAQRAQNMEEFKTMIKEMRLRKEREREFEKNQRTAPPPETPATP
jgi:hypothetical protein